MELDGIIKRVIPPARKRAQYKPTQKCKDLLATMISIIKWSEKWMPDYEGRKLEVTDKNGSEVTLELLNEKNEKINELNELSLRIN